ncbi:hypothetical protein [Breznakiella homolactica]|uniref:Thioredoxin family protein n=1 Tax=Breznakiella homolactica TaxID=2798577 RepID=A0A7T7XRH0_9SPIR|nr:hypothetical protein [Breznakiella homolactica]QQO11053.1 hypothetical protein JFL75_09090 [Breznakiella homolactica]
MIRKLTEAECRSAMENGDFPRELLEAAPMAAIILTQSWCPQWTAMRSYLGEAEAEAAEADPRGAAIYYIEYDKEPWFDEFMAFKENTYNNREIPYVRYYRNGAYHRDSNYIAVQGFLSRLGIGEHRG